MIFPTIQELSQDKFNRYEIALATAKCARLVTNEYVHQRSEAEASQTGNKETDKPLNTMIDKKLRDEKAVRIAIARLYNREYTITELSPEEQEKAERAVLEGPERPEPELDDLTDEEVDAETAEDATEETAEDAAEETAEDAAEETAEETVEETAEKTAEEPVEEPVEETAEVADETAE